MQKHFQRSQQEHGEKEKGWERPKKTKLNDHTRIGIINHSRIHD